MSKGNGIRGLLERIRVRLTGATGNLPIDATGAGLEFGGAAPSKYYAPQESERPPH